MAVAQPQPEEEVSRAKVVTTKSTCEFKYQNSGITSCVGSNPNYIINKTNRGAPAVNLWIILKIPLLCD